MLRQNIYESQTRAPQQITFDDINDHGDMELEIKEKQVQHRLMQLENTISGQMIDEVKSNYELRSKNAKYRLNVSAIWVKLINSSKSSVSVKEDEADQLQPSEIK